MVTANGSKPDTCQKLRQGGSAGAGGPLEARLQSADLLVLAGLHEADRTIEPIAIGEAQHGHACRSGG